MRQRAKDHFRGFVIAVLCFVAVGAAFAWHESQSGMPALTRAERHAAVRAKYVPVTVVETIERVVEVPGEPLPPIIERVEIEVEPRTVGIPVGIKIPVPCEPLTIGGDCIIEIIGEGRDKMARASWSASVSGPDWGPVTRGPVLSDEAKVTFEQIEAAAPPKYSRGWWFGAIKTPGGWGPTVSASLKRKRWTAKVGVGVAVNSPSISQVDGDLYSFSESVDPIYTVEFSRASR